MPRLFEAPRAEVDIRSVLAHTLDEWGPTKYWEYRDLIEEAFEEILSNPDCGRVMLASRACIRGHHIRKPGRNARHIVCYRVTTNGDVEVVRFLHDAMDHARHLPK